MMRFNNLAFVGIFSSFVLGASTAHDTNIAENRVRPGVNNRHSAPRARPRDHSPKVDTHTVRSKEDFEKIPRVKDSLDTAIEGVMDDLKIRGVSVAYFDETLSAEPLFRSYGYVSTNTDAPNVTPDTAFMIASVSKVVTGTAILKLAVDGVIDLDDDICDALPDEYYDLSACANPNYPDEVITWRMLMTHTSSMAGNIADLENGDAPSYGPNGGYQGAAVGNPTCPLTDVKGFYRDLLIDKETETSVGTSGTDINWYDVGYNQTWEDSRPGTTNEYSNLAFGYASALVEHVTGTTFDAYCKQHIFDPLGMTDTAWFSKDLPHNVIESQPITYENGKFEDIGHYCFIDYASGQLRTTARDMSKFLKSMINYGEGLMIPTAAMKTALECSMPGQSECDQGFVWFLLDKNVEYEDWLEPTYDLNWDHAAEHAGLEAGTQTQVVFFPESKVYALVFSNTDTTDGDAAQVLMYELLDKAPDVL